MSAFAFIPFLGGLALALASIGSLRQKEQRLAEISEVDVAMREAFDERITALGDMVDRINERLGTDWEELEDRS